jgi:maltooligosyltrehalose trehalohydrolase
MHHFTLWAPEAQSVEIEINGNRIPMTSEFDGYWGLAVGEAGPGTRYAFRIGGGDLLPDPRSPFQPEGVHGPSQLVDHDNFPWRHNAWPVRPLSSGVIYELHVGTFTPEGTFDSALAHLEYLVDLGVTHVEVMPVAEFSGTRGWGYDGVDLYAPHRAYGGPDAFKRFIDACHGCDMAVLLDVVYNHIGPEGGYLGKFGPYYSTRCRSPWGEGMNLDDMYAAEVRRFLRDNALMWFRDYRVDGLRLDAIHYMGDASAKHFLEELSEEVDSWEAHLGRPLVLIGESTENDPRVVRPREGGGFGFDAMWSEDFEHVFHTALTQDMGGYYEGYFGLLDMSTALRGFVYEGKYLPYLRRHYGKPLYEISGHRLIAYVQSHDHVGNRAEGERLIHLVGPERARLAAALLFASPYTPMLFQGEEWGASTPFLYFTDHSDPELCKAVIEGRRREFAGLISDPNRIPDPQARETFARSKLNWSELNEPEHARMLQWHRDLIRLRRSFPELTDGRRDRVEIEVDPEAEWLVLRRGNIVVACNFADEGQPLPLERHGRLEVLLASEPGADVPGELPPLCAVVAKAESRPPIPTPLDAERAAHGESA